MGLAVQTAQRAESGGAAPVREEQRRASPAPAERRDTLAPARTSPDLTGPKTRMPVLLSPAASRAAYARENPKIPRSVRGQRFTPAEADAMRRALRLAAPVLRCANQPIKAIGRLNHLLDDKSKLDDSVGEHNDNSPNIFIANDSKREYFETALHEIAHAALQEHDPRTCKTYKTSDDNPLVKEYRRATGWSADGKRLTPRAHDRPPTAYAHTNADEDMSESYASFLAHPAHLRAASPSRYAFFTKLAAALPRRIAKANNSAPSSKLTPAVD